MPYRRATDGAFMMQWSPDGTRYSIADYSSTSIIDANSGAVIRTLPTSSVGGR